MDRFQEVRQEGALLSLRVRPNNYGFQGKMCRGHDTAIFTMLYLILLTLWFHKTFKLIFLNQSSWPKTMYGIFSYTFGITIQYATVFPIKNKFWTVILTVFFLFSSAILISIMKSLFLNLYTNSLWVTSIFQVPITTGSV